MDGTQELASAVADSEAGLNNEEALLDRWSGAPEKIAEDVFRTRNMETGEMEDLNLFYPYQPKILHAYFYGDASIKNVYKGRRIGVSFVVCVAITLDALTHDDTNYAVVSTKKDQSQERLKDIRTLLDNSKIVGDEDVSNWLRTDNKNELILPNGATIRAFTGNPDGARGMDSARTVFVDEMAFLDDQQATMQAFMPFINLGSHRQMWQVSTPKVSNDLFLDTHERGAPNGQDGVISIKQPSFKNPADIDINTPLPEQDVEPVRPDMDVATVEAERAQDPQGFAQEYLCRPISDSYRFFTSDGIRRAAERGAQRVRDDGTMVGTYVGHSPATHARSGGKLVAGVDIGTDGKDDTAVAVWEHVGPHRYLRWHTCLDRHDLAAAGCQSHDPEDPEAVAQYLGALDNQMHLDRVFLDKTGPGYGFQKAVENRLGRKAQGFNFSDKDEVKRMMGDFNYALHNDLLTLVPDDTITDQLEAIVKEQRHETSKPRFTGKKHASDGKDDMAMALVLGAFPPNFDAERTESLHQRENVSGYDEQPQADDAAEADPSGRFKGVVQRSAGGARPHRSSSGRDDSLAGFMNANDSRTDSNYNRRHSRR